MDASDRLGQQVQSLNVSTYRYQTYSLEKTMCAVISTADIQHDAFFVLEEEAVDDLVTHWDGEVVEQTWESGVDELPDFDDLLAVSAAA